MVSPRERGERLLRKIDGDKVADNLLREYQDVAPDFARYLVEFAFGEIYARDGDLRHKEIVAITSLATMGGCDRQLETHVHGALNVGLSEADIVEVVMTLIPYVGFPKTLNAMAVVKRVIEKRRVPQRQVPS
ncbi:MAG: carboxymuconolactone decarboxylase family protein [Candidatus Eremiobacteraeota bacterium]|nr:carboxymuconolactone decarboxylase family protein [Candidatus Eremiobacteraeota bacterium]MBV8433019.1 carboxymuconolactone decarboxylase family protein [Candidatus Eremiobacteraeota bacterium]MBV8721920.1 carboxymuconolactone decarboxylase family protein [Candidatus Eremiobacteraeota bacterium]